MKTKIFASLLLFTAIAFSSLLSTQAKAQCQANWNWQQTSTGPCMACFTDISTGAIAWSWSFSGGTPATSSSKNPCITYPPSGGGYSVCLTITVPSAVGNCYDTLCKTVTLQCGTGIISLEQIDLSLSVTNPVFSSADINYSIPSSGNVKLSLFDIVGNKIGVLENVFHKSAGMHSYTLSTGGFSKGIYFIHLDFEGATITQKIIIAE